MKPVVVPGLESVICDHDTQQSKFKHNTDAAVSKIRGYANCVGKRLLFGDRPSQDADKRSLLWRNRAAFGISRIGSVTRLDTIGIPVVQTVRPNALSNVVSQGKGFTYTDAFLSSAMEAIETWAAERLPSWRFYTQLAPEDRDFFAYYSCPSLVRKRIEGIDLLSGKLEGVPASLVETRYTSPYPYPVPFDQTTTGLGAGFCIESASKHAMSEVIERYSVRKAETDSSLVRIDLETIPFETTHRLLRKVRSANVYIALDQAMSAPLPTVRCHVVDREFRRFPRLPAGGYGCRSSLEAAINAAILEAVQARLSAISGAREDITRQQYPPNIEQRHVDKATENIVSLDNKKRPLSMKHHDLPSSIDSYLEALAKFGVHAVYVVPVFRDLNTDLSVVRVVAPPLFGA